MWGRHTPDKQPLCEVQGRGEGKFRSGKAGRCAINTLCYVHGGVIEFIYSAQDIPDVAVFF